mmetsp:Transcript_28366/g.32626  ORF Transcript_28366/g.32626 Transcript_28366/m.32626 type:complete len:218 (+) Transcript_28366:104-757(+)|eukprot:CAMPEP_0194357680 /NCGR_PEP_ID=MMETSP0174-20130528/5132_1 /TAXON_ID=216777 /ORGANISM="Proboscia alata, Strain PI-D3" /LENGTH=217 /DNA_ID=CAMNT_0039127801 /DNA_START=104 /DNA_END=757 /DNA_ORIENTATION=+
MYFNKALLLALLFAEGNANVVRRRGLRRIGTDGEVADELKITLRRTMDNGNGKGKGDTSDGIRSRCEQNGKGKGKGDDGKRIIDGVIVDCGVFDNIPTEAEDSENRLSNDFFFRFGGDVVEKEVRNDNVNNFAQFLGDRRMESSGKGGSGNKQIRLGQSNIDKNIVDPIKGGKGKGGKGDDGKFPILPKIPILPNDENEIASPSNDVAGQDVGDFLN